MTAPGIALCVLLLAAPAPAGAAGGKVRPAGMAARLGDERLSDERTLTRWARPTHRARIRAAPRRGARTKGRLRLRTEDGVHEVYLVLRSRRDARDRAWLKIRMLGRPNGRTGWVRRGALGALNVVRTHLRIDRGRLRATLYRRGRRIWSSPVGVGKPGTPTPAGRFYIRERLRALGGIYGPWAFGTSAYSTLTEWPGGGVVGIHGTDQPGLIPGRVSHGCVRVPNDRVVVLRRLMPVGTPVRIV